jgi:glycerophosphoryl diester phosphodiesterase
LGLRAFATRGALAALMVVPFFAPGNLDAEPTIPSAGNIQGRPNDPLPDLLTGTFAELVQGPRRFPGQFRTTAIQGVAASLPGSGNSLDGFRRALEEGVRAVEGDFRLNADGNLVATHDDRIGGDCGSVSSATTAQIESCRLPNGYRVATLPQLLDLPFEVIHLDLKDTGLVDLKVADPTRAIRAVERAIADVRAAGRADDVVLMVYDTPGAAQRLSAEPDIRGGLKGYPTTTDEALRMNHLAAFYGFELVCVSVELATGEIAKDAARLGVYQLPFADLDTDLGLLKTRAATGIGGLITPNYEIVQREVAPLWLSPRRIAG